VSGRMDKAGSAREDVAVEGAGGSPMGTERARGEDTLSVIERDWKCRRCESVNGPLMSDGRCEICVTDDGHDGDVIELIPADEHRGAVGALRKIADAQTFGSGDGGVGMRNEARRALARLDRGQ
jgi:hypothetical protein